MPGSSDSISRAASLYRAGRLREAEVLLREMLARDPDSADALFFLGSIAADAGRPGAAEELLRRALARRPLEAAFHAALGNALSRLGRHQDALGSYRSALQLNPGLVELHVNIGNAQRAQGLNAEALASFDRILAHKPAHIAARLGRAWALAALGRREDALAGIAALRAAHPHSSDLGLDEVGLRLALGDRVDAVRQLPYFQRLLRVDPRPELRLQYAAALLELKRHAPAADELRKVVAERPADAAARSDLGLALLGLDRPGEAVAQLEEALRLDPVHWQALHNLALAKFRLTAVDEARALLARARAVKPDDAGLLANLGYLHGLARDFESGEALLREAMALDPADRKARRYLALQLLGRGKFEEGWDHWIQGSAPERAVRGRELALPWWQGDAVSGRKLLVWSEQGIGDQIMFCNPVPDLVQSGARVVLECTPRLERLFARSFPQVTVVPRSAAGRDAIERAAPQLQAPMSRLAPYLRRSWQAFPRHGGYLRAAPERVAYWRGRLAALGPGRTVGLSWAGGTAKTGRLRRSTALADWLPLLRMPGARFVSLQYTDSRAELARLRDEHGVEVLHWQEAIDDYDETAALVSALDAVASVCTSIIHLAGALGRPAYVAVPWWPSWRYLFEGEAMPWYPSVRLIRQETASDWSAPVRRIAALVAEGHLD